MKNLWTIVFCVASALYGTPAMAELPTDIRVPLSKAVGTQDAVVIDAVRDHMVATFPAYQEEIDAYVTSVPSGESSARLSSEQPLEKEAADNVTSPWSGEVDAGLSIENGNTNKEMMKASGKLVYEVTNWKNIFSAKAKNESENNARIAEEYRAKNQLRYKLTERDYVFGEVEYVDDRYSGYDFRLSELLGYGRYLVKSDDVNLSLELSAGARQTRLTTGDKEESILGKMSGHFDWLILKGLEFEQDASFSMANDVHIIESITGLKTTLYKDIFMKLSYEIERISDVPVGTKNTDTLTSLTLGYRF